MNHKTLDKCVMILGISLLVIFSSNAQVSRNESESSVFTETEYTGNAFRQEERVKRALHYNFDHEALLIFMKNKKDLQFPITTFEGTKNLVFKRVNILSPEYILSTSDGQEVTQGGEYVFYHGYVEGKPESKVALTYAYNEVHLLIMDDDGNFEINPLTDQLYSGYYSSDHLETKEWECFTEDVHPPVDGESRQSDNYRSGDCVEIYLEIDYAMYVKKGSDVSNTESWALSLMNQVSILYIEWGIPLTIAQIHIYTSPDPFANSGNTQATLPVFANHINNITWNGRLAHLLSGRNMGGGIAYLNSLCSNFSNVGISANLSGGSTPYPNYSWNVMVVAHELGHNFGSPHTHDCSWNGNNTSIDGCGFIKGYGGCDGPIPVKGTIMSYCHLVSGVGIDLALGFGLQPGALIQSRYQNASCATGTACVDVPPFNDVCNRAEELSVQLSCLPAQGTLISASPSGSSAITCGIGGLERDVWFKFEYPVVSTLTIETRQLTNGLSDLILEVYTGDCNNLTVYACDDNNGEGNHALIAINDAGLQGQVIYVRVLESGSDEEGTFGICVYSSELPCNNLVDSLINIYDATAGPSWINNAGWVDGKAGLDCNYCQWYGVTCDPNGNIIGLDLSNNNLNGILSSSFQGLIDLESMDLSYNVLDGPIPDTWAELDKLILLNLSNNQLDGGIPPSFENMYLINSIFLDNNSLSGPLPLTLGNNFRLRTFSASNNQLTGCFPQSFSSFCYRDSLNLDNNPGLPYSGDVTLLCYDGSGRDYDQDSYCLNIDDCDDYNAAVNEGASEVCDGIDNNCDGIVDEGFSSGPNAWIGPETGGTWSDGASWSLGHPPLGCEEIEIGMVGQPKDLTVPDSYNSYHKSIAVGPGSALTLGIETSIILAGGGNITNHGTLNLDGYLEIKNLDGSGKNGILNSGTLNMPSGFYINISDVDLNGIFNQPGGIVNSSGSINIFANSAGSSYSGIKNEGTFYNSGYMYIAGIFVGGHLVLSPNAVFSTSGQNDNIYLSSFNEGGN